MAIDKSTKQNVTADWLAAFPQLTPYARDKFYKVLGPLVVGLELIKLPASERYRPHFVMYPLWGKDPKQSLDVPILLREFYDRKQFQYNIPYYNHGVPFADVLTAIQAQAPISFDGDISLGKLFEVYDDQSKRPPLHASPNSYLQGHLRESKLKTALFIDAQIAEKVFHEIKTIDWNVSNFKWFGIDVPGWLDSMQEAINSKENFLRQIDANKADKKISMLKSSKLKF